MKQNRCIPFGYMLANGQTAIQAEEAAAVGEIFAWYLSGESYQRISDRLNATTIQYSPQGHDWNKHMVKRILENQRLCGTMEYAKIIEPCVYQQAAALRESKATLPGKSSKDILLIAKKVECAICGKPILRHTKSGGKPKWTCTGGCQIHLTDELVIEQVSALLQAAENAPPSNEAGLLTLKRLKNELNREWDKAQRDEQQLRRLIFQIAAAEYALCGEPVTPTDGFNANRFLRITDKLFYQGGQLALLTRSGQMISPAAERSEAI